MFNWVWVHLFDYTSTMIIYEMCVDEPTATVTNVTQQERRKYPPHPLSTIELQKHASHYFCMSSEHTMKVEEELILGQGEEALCLERLALRTGQLEVVLRTEAGVLCIRRERCK